MFSFSFVDVLSLLRVFVLRLAGYYKEPEKSAEVFLEDGWFKTGDIVKVHPNGSFQIIDRAKNIFKNALGEYIA